MSGWRIAVRELHELGGGPAPIAALSTDHSAMARAVELGLVYHVGREWKLTHRGRAWAEGRLQIDGNPQRARATWLAALPQPNEIRLEILPGVIRAI